MRTSDFDYELPPGLIAQTPAEPRDASRLMAFRRGGTEFEDHTFRDLPTLLRPGDLLVANDTRVMAARLHGWREDTGGKVEALLVRETADGAWDTLFKPAKAALPGRRFVFTTGAGQSTAVCLGRDEETVRLAFAPGFDPSTAGEVPLPPYIRGFTGDAERYQTVFSREPKSAAAPTAGLHFTPDLIAELDVTGVGMTYVTLEVGPGTFKPVSVDDPRDHRLHSERVRVPADTAEQLQAAQNEGRRIIAVGTTVVRTLEHVARETGRFAAWEGETELKLLPGDPFLAIDGLITNFHLPRSTLLMLVAAFAGYETTMAAYRRAVAERYRFYSFGDAMLILP
ncbi:MAG TPA: tRNA preQ1(34) S-adenosylmethionine ribosyltransferase-isomerase QueA [Tepidiformaceae bacterium]|nr:tRNA preQ1(34) S-adenosylmethionine ribosyltransferase-isomerase QueA [Tepidiformaceae bacterium]